MIGGAVGNGEDGVGLGAGVGVEQEGRKVKGEK